MANQGIFDFKMTDSNSSIPGFTGFDFGSGGMFNGFNQAGMLNLFGTGGTPSGQAAQPSGGFNTIPGMPGASSTSGNDFMSSMFSPGGSFTANNTQNLNPFTLFGGSTGSIPGMPQVTGKDLSKIYGKGIGNALSQFLNSGAGFNQGVIQAQMNAAMPLEQRALAQMSNMFGSNGLASSSTAALAFGDFESQFQANLENMFAQEYQQSVQNYLNVLMGVKGDAKENKAQGNSWLNMLTQGLSIIPGLFGL